MFNSDDELMVMRPYQIVATEAILKRIEIASNYKLMGTTDAGGLDASSREFLDAAMADYNAMFGTNYDTSGDKFSSYHKDVARRLENRELDLLIVVNMFLTGFDAKTLNTLWVDKKLRYHGLIQAFSRTNRILNSVKTFGQTAWGLSPRDLQDYQSMYLDIYGELRPQQAADVENINDDLVFEIELVKQVAIDLAAILALVQKYHDDNCQDKEIPVEISRAIGTNPDLRSKKDLIERFIGTLSPGADVDRAWGRYVAEAKARELDRIIAEDHLKPVETRAFMEAAFRDGFVPVAGTAITRILPPVSPFADGDARASVKTRVIDHLREFFNRFTDV